MRDVILTACRRLGEGHGRPRPGLHRNLPVTIAGVEMNFARGYQWVDVRAGAAFFRFVNTHLEAFSSDLALAQAVQMVRRRRPATGHDHRVRLQLRPTARRDQADRHVPHKAPYEFLRCRRVQRPVAPLGARPRGLDVRASPSS